MTPQQWLEQRNVDRTLLVQVQYLNDGLKTAYFSTHPFQSLPSDVPANIAFIDSVVAAPLFSKRMGLFTGSSSASRSDFTLFNDDSLSDLIDGNVYNQKVNYYIGDASWPLSDFIEIAQQRAESLSIGSDDVRFNMRDPSLILDTTINTGVFTSGPNEGKAKPLCIGEVHNIEPVLEDVATHKYRVHFDAVNDVTAVRDNGVAVVFTKDNPNGCFTLNQAPVGRITCDVQGAKPVTYLQYPGEVITWLLTTFTDESNIGDLSTLPNYLIGIFQKEPKRVRQVVDLICNSVNGFHFYKRNGQFVAQIAPLITGVPQAALSLDDIIEDGIRVRKTIDPVSKVIVNYRQNFTEQADGLAGSVSSIEREFYSRQFTTVEAVNALPNFPDAEPITIDSCLVLEADAQALATSKANAASAKRTLYEISALGLPFSFELGQEIYVKYWHFGLLTGVTGIVTALTDNPIDGEVTVELWR